jgi:hypothetical protein
VIKVEAVDTSPPPASLVAYTEIEYAVPLVNGEIVQDVPVPLVEQEFPPG